MIQRLQQVARTAAILAMAIGPVAAPVCSFAAANTKLADGIRQGEATQTQIKGQVLRATDDLTSIISELNRNGIGGEDVKILVKIRDILGDLTEKDMAVVIALLQEARSATDPSQFRGQATDAVVKQQSIIDKMKQLLREYQRQQELYTLSLRFTELAQRQNGNLKEAKALVRSVQNRQQLDDLQKSNKTLQVSEEESIRDETHVLLAKLASLAADADADTADRLKKSLAQAQKGLLEESLRTAADRLKEGQLFSAATAEKNSRDRLYELASLVAPSEDTATKLRKAAEKLDKAIAEQKLVIAQTGVLPPRGAQNDEAYLKVEDKQADNVDLTDRLRKSLEVIAPTVTDVLKVAQDQMQSARTGLNSFQREPAITPETAALAKLEEARKLLDVQIAKADAEKPKGDNLAQAKALKEKIAQLRMDQQKLNDQTKAATPRTSSELAKTEAQYQQIAKDLQIETAPESLPAADELSAAAKVMEQAQASLDKGLTSEAQPPEKSAVDHLVNAEKLLEQQIAKLEHDKDALAKLEESRDKVAKLIQDEQRVALDTAKEVGKEEAQKDNAKKDDANKPDAAKPDANKPDAAKPDDNKPDANKPDANKPDAGKPEANKADANKPDSAKPDASKPDANKPDTNKPDANKAEANKPESNKPESNKADANKPDSKQANADKPDANKPDANKPDADKANANKPDAHPENAAANKKTGQEQGEIAKKTEEAKQTLPEEGKEASKPLDQAKQAMNAAKKSLDDNQPKPALPQEQQAINHLNKAKEALDRKINELQKELGLPQDNANKLDNLAKALEKAQQDLNNAQQKLRQDPAQQLAKEQQKVAEELKQKQEKNPDSKPIQQAKDAAENAAKELAQNDLPKALKEMLKVQEAIKQADAEQPKPDAKPGEKGEPLKDVAEHQAAVKKATEQLAKGETPPAQQAAKELGQVANNVTDAAADDKGALPQPAQQALQKAEEALNNAAKQAEAGNQPDASQQAATAQSEIAQAQAAVALAQQGLQPGQMADAKGPPGPPQPGQPGQPAPAPGETPGQGPPAPNGPPGKADENQPAQAKGDRQDTQAGATANGPRGAVAGGSGFMNLPARDRQALKQTQKEKYPEEYGPAIEQYLKNLSDQESK